MSTFNPEPLSFDRYDAWARDPRFAVASLAARNSADGMTSVIRTTQQGAFDDPATDDYVLTLIERASPGLLKADLGHGCKEWQVRSGDMLFAPANQYNVYAGDSAYELIFFAWNAGALHRHLDAADCQSADFGVLHADVLRRPVVAKLVRSLWRDAADGAQGMARLRYEAQLNLLLVELLALSKRGQRRQVPMAFSANTAACLTDYIESQLDTNFGHEDLAIIAGVPSFDLQRRFVATFRETPHGYVTQMRVERACKLIQDRENALADIAIACGFCDQSHLNRVFKAHTGVTPGAYRREHMN